MLLVTANDEHDPRLQASPWIDANAFHLLWDEPPYAQGFDRERAIQRLFDQVEGFLDAPSHGKPKILSSDGAGTLDPEVSERLLAMLPRDGSVAYEHFDQRSSRALLGGIVPPRGHLLHGPDRQALRQRTQVLGGRASELTTGGRLSLADGRWFWNSEPVNLVGMSLSYGLLSTTRFHLPTLLDFLHFYGINFLRVWVTEQWTGWVPRDDQNRPGQHTALAPWPWAESYRLDRHDPKWFERLRTFLKAAADRALVVQVTAFDWGGLRHLDEAGRWGDSPYNPANGSSPLSPEVEPGGWPQDFAQTSGPFWDEVVQPLVTQLARTVAAFPNAFLEIANEPRPTMPGVHEWQVEVAKIAQRAAASGQPTS